MTKNPLKIGILLRNRHDGPGGLEKVLQQIERGLKKHDVEIFVYALYKPTYIDFTKDFQNFYYLPVPETLTKENSKLPKSLQRTLYKAYVSLNGDKLFSKMAVDKINILITLDLSKQFLKNYKFLQKFKRRTNTPIVSWVHSSLSNTSNKLAQKILSKVDIFDGHLAISKGIQEELKSLYNQKNSFLVHNPIAPAELIPRNHKKLLYIGRIDKNKRVHSLLQNLTNLKGEWQLDIYGSTGSNDGDAEFKEYIHKLSLNKNVIFHGWTPNPWTEITEAGVLLLNSKQEGFSLVICEALMRGVPVVSSNCPTGTSELIKNNLNGWLYPVHEEHKGIAIIQKIISKEIPLPVPLEIQNSVSHLTQKNILRNIYSSLKQILQFIDEGT